MVDIGGEGNWDGMYGNYPLDFKFYSLLGLELLMKMLVSETFVQKIFMARACTGQNGLSP